jgi:hypothetical protein
MNSPPIRLAAHSVGHPAMHERDQQASYRERQQRRPPPAIQRDQPRD